MVERIDSDLVASGRELARIVDSSGLNVEAAFWRYDQEVGKWNLVLALEGVAKLGKLVFYQRISNILNRPDSGLYRFPTSSITVIDSHEPVLKGLRHLWEYVMPGLERPIGLSDSSFGGTTDWGRYSYLIIWTYRTWEQRRELGSVEVDPYKPTKEVARLHVYYADPHGVDLVLQVGENRTSAYFQYSALVYAMGGEQAFSSGDLSITAAPEGKLIVIEVHKGASNEWRGFSPLETMMGVVSRHGEHLSSGGKL